MAIVYDVLDYDGFTAHTCDSLRGAEKFAAEVGGLTNIRRRDTDKYPTDENFRDEKGAVIGLLEPSERLYSRPFQKNI